MANEIQVQLDPSLTGLTLVLQLIAPSGAQIASDVACTESGTLDGVYVNSAALPAGLAIGQTYPWRAMAGGVQYAAGVYVHRAAATINNVGGYDTDDVTLTVASSAQLQVGDVLAVDGGAEQLLVVAIPNSTSIKVKRARRGSTAASIADAAVLRVIGQEDLAAKPGKWDRGAATRTILDDDGTTALIVQPVTDNGTLQTVGKAQ